MKKLLIFALCLLGICNAHAEMMTAQEIILTEVYHMQPWDGKESDGHLEPGHTRTNFLASVDANELYIGADTDAPAYVEVIDQENGDVVAEEEFEGEELIDHIQLWMENNTVDSAFQLKIASESRAEFEQVRIPCFDDSGMAIDARTFATRLRKYLSKEPFNIDSKVVTSGLGKCILIIGEK